MSKSRNKKDFNFESTTFTSIKNARNKNKLKNETAELFDFQEVTNQALIKN
jgi:hypothetical protein